jgi:hypothetical protein
MKVVYSSSDVEQKSVQRFLRVDPLYENSMGISSYDYCHDNPLIFVDPNGKAERKVVIKGLTSTINIFSGVLEISTGVAGAPESGGLSTVLIVDGLARISMSGPELLEILVTGESHLDIPDNILGALGRGIDYARDIPSNVTGSAEGIMSAFNDAFAFMGQGGNGAAIAEFVVTGKKSDAVIALFTYFSYPYSLFQDLAPINEKGSKRNEHRNNKPACRTKAVRHSIHNRVSQPRNNHNNTQKRKK